jgi:hypothetical protein
MSCRPGVPEAPQRLSGLAVHGTITDFRAATGIPATRRPGLYSPWRTTMYPRYDTSICEAPPNGRD